MKKLFVLLILSAVLVFSLGAQDTTWTNPYDFQNINIPRSMLSVVSNGTMYDGIDVLLSSPGELSEFEGTSLYTAYGNYESFSGLGPDWPVTAVNPFSTTGLGGEFDSGSTSLGNVAFLLGYMMPFMGMQAGIVGGFQTEYSNGLTGYITGVDGDVPQAEYGFDETEVEDLDGVNSSAYTSSEAYYYTNRTTNNSFRLGTGVDLGFMGVSLYGNFNSRSSKLGGTYEYKWTDGADDAEFNPVGQTVTTSKTIEYGYKDGDAAIKTLRSGNWQVAATGQLPFSFMDIAMPITASLKLGGSHDGGTANGIPQKVSITDKYVATDGAGGTVDDVSTLTYTTGVANLNDATTNAGELGTGLHTGNATYAAAITQVMGGALADNTDAVKDGSFNIGIGGRVDPKIELSDILTARTRLQLDLDLEFEKNNGEGIKEVSFSRADNGAAGNSTYSFKRTESIPEETTNTTITFEMGGILEAKSSSGFVTVSSGLFYNPTFALSSTANKDEVTVTTATSLDTTGATPEATNANVLTDIGLGGAAVQGTITETTTTTYSGKDKDNTVTHRFIIPVSATLNLVPNKISLIGGYLLFSEVEKNTVVEASSQLSGQRTGTTSDGTAIEFPASTSVASTTGSTTNSTWTPAEWAGQMNFMVRWTPNENLTVDFFGQSIMAALDMDIFSGNHDDNGYDGFNLNNFISNLGMSVTFSM